MMLATLSNKKKLKLLGFALVPVLFLCYKLAISKTITEYRTYKTNMVNEQQAGASMNAGTVLKNRQKELDLLLANYTLDTLNSNKSFLTVVSEFCRDNGLELREYKPMGVSPGNPVKFMTRSVTVEGPFINCLQLVYALETQYQAGRVSSVLYKSATDPKDESVSLSCTVFVQNLID